MAGRVRVDEKTRVQYAGLYVLAILTDPEQDAAALLSEDEDLLTPMLTWLVESGYAAVGDDDVLRATAKGADVVDQFKARYHRFLQDYDVFCAVDLEVGEFAFARYDDFSDRTSWEAFLDQDRWDDLRIAVAQYEGQDPVEIIFMNLVSQGRFGRNAEGWGYDLLLGAVWDEIARICNNAVQLEDLGYDDAGEHIPPEAVVSDVIEQGRELMRQLRG